MSVAVVVGPSRTGAESAGTHASLLGYIFKLAIAEITIEHVAPVSRDVNVQPPVIVEIGDGHAHSPAAPGEARRLGNVFESPIRLWVVQRDHRVAAVTVAIHSGTFDGDDIQLAIIVAIKEANPAAHGFNDVALVRR